MKIGIDAGAVSITDDRLKVGIYRVTKEFLRILPDIDRKNTYEAYSFSSISNEVKQDLSKRLQYVTLSPSAGYMKFRLPLYLALHPVDVFIGMSQCLPSMRQGKAIGVIHDLGFLHNPKLYDKKSAVKLKQQTKELVTHSPHILTISETVKKDIVSTYSMISDKVTVCYEGVSSVFTQFGKKIVRSRPYFLFVGSLRKGKQIPLLLTAFEKFLRKNKNYDLVLIGGDYWKDEDIEKTIQKLKLEKNVITTGYLPDKKVAEYYRGATAYVTASAWEGFCLPAVEAMSSGCPVVAVKNGALPEILGNAGILVENSAESIAKGMYEVIQSKKRYECVTKGLTRAKHFTWEKFAKQTQSVIEHL